MAEDARRSAEIRRMASQKVAAELIKYQPFSTDDELDKAFSHFLDLVDRIDADVVEAGDSASGSRFPGAYDNLSETAPKASPTPTPHPASKPASGPAKGLAKLPAEKVSLMIQLLEKQDAEKLKWKLYEMGLTMLPEDAAKEMNMNQAREILDWTKELST